MVAARQLASDLVGETAQPKRLVWPQIDEDGDTHFLTCCHLRARRRRPGELGRGAVQQPPIEREVLARNRMADDGDARAVAPVRCQGLG